MLATMVSYVGFIIKGSSQVLFWGVVIYFAKEWYLQQNKIAKSAKPSEPTPGRHSRSPKLPNRSGDRTQSGASAATAAAFSAHAAAKAAGADAIAAEAAAAAAAASAADEEDAPLQMDAEAHKSQIESLLAAAQAQASKLGDNRLTIEHMVLALADNPRFGEILQCAEGLTEGDLKKAVKKSRVMFNHPDISTEDELVVVPPTALVKYGRDLTAAARERKLDPVIGRADELRRLINILSRRTKNNPCILGEPGVGKTSLVEGLAQRIVASDVPEDLRNTTIIALDMGQMMAGALFPGEFEQRMSQVLKELTDLGSCILFIDDIHTVTGPNAQQGGGVMDASILLKPILARGELRCIGCTSLDKFRKFIEKDPALERRFQQLPMEPPTVPQTVSILRGLRMRYERHHGVRISDTALVAAASLSDRYLAERHLPDKAIDVIDEAAARVKMERALKPETLDRLERRIRDLNAEKRLLRRGAGINKNDATALAELEAELEGLMKTRLDLSVRFEAEAGEAEELIALQEVIDKLADDLEQLDCDEEAAAADPDHSSLLDSKASPPATPATVESPPPPAPAAITPVPAPAPGKKKGKKGKDAAEPSAAATATAAAVAAAAAAVPVIAAAEAVAAVPVVLNDVEKAALRADLDSRLEVAQTQARQLRKVLATAATAPMVSRHEVTEGDVARIISNWTGIPLTKLVESECDKLLTLGDELHKRIIGQEEAVGAVAEAIHRSRAGMKDPNGPIASFLFLGPTGVGKTELAKALASYLFNSEEAMVRLDMSEYMEKHAVSKLIGAPPGYVGFDEGGQLTEAVRRKPYTVVLFDEVEKAHVDVFNLLLQVLDDGRVTDSQGRTVSFKNAIIILTSNLGSKEIYRASAGNSVVDVTRSENVRTLVMDQVRKHFPPEFVNRVDEFIIFEPLKQTEIRQIVSLRTKGVVKRLAEKKMRLVMEDRALGYLAVKGFDPVFGARPVKRAIQRELETPLAQALLRGEFQEDDTILVSTVADGTRLTFKRVRGSVTEAAGPSREGAVNSRSGAITGSEPAVAAEIAHITDSALPSPASTSPAAPSGPTGKNAPSLPKRATGGKAAIKVAAAPPAASTSAPAAVVDQNGASSNGSTNGNHGASSSSGVESEAQVSGSESAAHPQQQAQGNGRSSSVEAAVQGDEGSATFSTEELQAVAAMSAAAGGAEVTEIFLPGTRPVRFDPQHEMRTLVESGVDLSLDGGAMNTDDYTLPTEAG